MTFDSVDFPVAPNFPNADGSIPAHADAQGKLTRWTLDVDTGAIDRCQTLDVASEFPRIDDRFAASRHRHGYIAAASQRAKGDGGLFHEITHIDCDTGEVSTWDAGFGNGVSEPGAVRNRGGVAEGARRRCLPAGRSAARLERCGARPPDEILPSPPPPPRPTGTSRGRT